MYRQSSDLRFVRSRNSLQRAFIDITLEKRSTNIAVKELTDRAGVNRMTFYSHYDEVSDILREFIDDVAARIMSAMQVDGGVNEGGSEVRTLLIAATSAMQDEMEFYRLVASDGKFELYRTQFRKTFAILFRNQLVRSERHEGAELELTAGMIASAVTYAYLDWLSGKYGDLSINDLVFLCEKFVSAQIQAVE
ncbi:TetR/AcrR family transcriptional regulator [Adlercreutzia sp. ZJ304]|uniref:TetR/AcrR family transcriptional regulator n=1 Tax=Adlercreutzia sp. ZJ304 TaxID=2709791 RepID=UPI0013ED8099|nr:TetR/AcrR family transcriptional regulator [Adlercreutzia sp. ZJ304]